MERIFIPRSLSAESRAAAKETLQVVDKNVTRYSFALDKYCVASRRRSLSSGTGSHLPMSPSDFLHKGAVTGLCEHYIAAGARCRLSTNSEHVLEAARATFVLLEDQQPSPDFSLRFWIDDADTSRPPWPKPYVRGLDHLVFASFDEGSSMLANLRARHVIGRFSPAMAADEPYWRTVIFPMLLTIVSASIGIAELHCACVARGHQGLLLAGPSGAGKSTLALALSQTGFRFVSDDRTFCSLENGQAQVWTLPTQLKLRLEAAHWFGELPHARFTDTRNGPSLWLEPEHIAGVKRVRSCRPSLLIFLERREPPKFRLSPVSSPEAIRRLNADLLAELPDAAEKRSRTIQKVVELPCWRMEYGGHPQAIAQQLSDYLAGA